MLNLFNCIEYMSYQMKRNKNRFLYQLVLLLTSFLLLSSSEKQSQPAADLIIWNGKVVTADKKFTIAGALVVIGDKIIAVGTNDDVLKFAGRQKGK